MNKFNVMDKKNMGAKAILVRQCMGKLDVKRCLDVANHLMGKDATEYLVTFSSLVLNEIDSKVDLDEMLRVYDVMYNVSLDKDDVREALFLEAIYNALTEDQARLHEIEDEAGRADRIIKKYEKEVIKIFGGSDYLADSIKYHSKMIGIETN